MVDKYEDPFVRIASMIGGDEYLKVARSLLKAEDATDEEIASSTGLRINMVRKVLYDLFGKSLITGIRVKDERKGWFVYRWRTRREEVEHFIENQKKKITERLQQRLDYENASDFIIVVMKIVQELHLKMRLMVCSNVHHVKMY